MSTSGPTRTRCTKVRHGGAAHHVVHRLAQQVRPGQPEDAFLLGQVLASECRRREAYVVSQGAEEMSPRGDLLVTGDAKSERRPSASGGPVLVGPHPAGVAA